MRIDYNDIVRSVALNIGIESPNNKHISIIKRDIYMSLLKIMRKGSPIKRVITEDITSSKSLFMLPEDFFTAFEVIFYSENGNKYESKEIEIEQFERWNPNPEISQSNFEEVALNQNPSENFWNEDNVELDGYIGYYFTDEEDVSRLVWKPGINGSVKIIYSSITDEQPESIESAPDLHYSFRELLILGPTIQGLLRKPSKGEIEYNEKLLSIRMYQDEFKQMLKEFVGYINRRTETPRIDSFDFLNDINQTLWTADW